MHEPEGNPKDLIPILVTNTRPTLELLDRLYRKLACSWWPGGHMALDLSQKPVDFRDREATFFSIGGAAQAIADCEWEGAILMSAIHETCYWFHGSTVSRWEDRPGRTRDEVLRLIKWATIAASLQIIDSLVVANDIRSRGERPPRWQRLRTFTDLCNGGHFDFVRMAA